MIKLMFCLRRLPTMSRDAFQDYWRNVHAPLVLRHAGLLGIQRYVQCHTMDDALFAQLAAGRGAHPAFDGVAEIWRSDVTPAPTPEWRQASQQLKDDERRFIDLAASPIFFTQENLVIDG